MKILFISAVLPYPLQSGGQVRIYKLLQEVSQYHEITLFSFIRDEKEKLYLPKLNFCRKVEVFWRGRALQLNYLLRSIFGKYPLLLESYKNPRLQERIRQELVSGHYNLVHIEPFYVYPSLPEISLPLVVAEHNLEYEVYENFARNHKVPILGKIFACEASRIKLFEQKICRLADHLIVVSPEDKKSLAGQIKGKPISVVENGVNPDLFFFRRRKINPNSPKFLFIGNLSWLPNQEAVGRLLGSIWPKLKEIYPQSSLKIIGRNVSAKTKRVAANYGAIIKDDALDIIDEYQQADIFLAPMTISGGSKYKIIEAMAVGLPVVSTRDAVSGLEVKENVHFLEAQTPDEFCRQVETLLLNPQIQAKLTSSARQLIVQKYSWTKIGQKLLSVWKQTYEKNRN